MHVVRHDDEIAQLEFSRSNVGTQHVDRQQGIVFRLEQGSPHAGACGGEKGARRVEDLGGTGIAERFRHRRGQTTIAFACPLPNRRLGNLDKALTRAIYDDTGYGYRSEARTEFSRSSARKVFYMISRRKLLQAGFPDVQHLQIADGGRGADARRPRERAAGANCSFHKERSCHVFAGDRKAGRAGDDDCGTVLGRDNAERQYGRQSAAGDDWRAAGVHALCAIPGRQRDAAGSQRADIE